MITFCLFLSASSPTSTRLKAGQNGPFKYADVSQMRWHRFDGSSRLVQRYINLRLELEAEQVDLEWTSRKTKPSLRHKKWLNFELIHEFKSFVHCNQSWSKTRCRNIDLWSMCLDNDVKQTGGGLREWLAQSFNSGCYDDGRQSLGAWKDDVYLHGLSLPWIAQRQVFSPMTKFPSRDSII